MHKARDTLTVTFSMRILVQEPTRKVYFDGVAWNEDAAQAKSFENVAQAEAVCEEHDLGTALIVVETKDGQHDISYAVGHHNAVLVSKPATTRIKSLF